MVVYFRVGERETLNLHPLTSILPTTATGIQVEFQVEQERSKEHQHGIFIILNIFHFQLPISFNL